MILTFCRNLLIVLGFVKVELYVLYFNKVQNPTRLGVDAYNFKQIIRRIVLVDFQSVPFYIWYKITFIIFIAYLLYFKYSFTSLEFFLFD